MHLASFAVAVEVVAVAAEPVLKIDGIMDFVPLFLTK